MQQTCDLFFSAPSNSERMKFIKIFDKNFSYEPSKQYVGFLGVNVHRIKMIPVVDDLRKNKIACFSVPVEYRDKQGITIDQALELAKIYATSIKATTSLPTGSRQDIPVFWLFDLAAESNGEERVGGKIMIDRLDGHVWTSLESEQYMYDYNNIF